MVYKHCKKPTLYDNDKTDLKFNRHVVQTSNSSDVVLFKDRVRHRKYKKGQRGAGINAAVV